MRIATLAWVALTALAGATGCTASSSGPVAGFDGSWTINKRASAAQAPSLTRAAVQEATAHCAGSGKRFVQLDLKESPPGALSTQAESELKFQCD